MMYQLGHHGSGVSWVLMILSMLVVWGLLIAVGVAVYRLNSTHPNLASVPARAPNAEKILAERFATGEIDETEYAARSALLRERHPQ